MRIYLAVLSLVLVAGISALGSAGTGYAGLLALVVWFMALAALSERQADRVWHGILWASVGCAALAAVQLPWTARPTGPFGSPNYLGAFAAVMLFVALGRGGVAGHAALGANALAVVLSQSRGAVLAVGAGFAVALWRRSRLLSGAMLALGALGAALLQRPESRIQIWEIGLAAALQRPLTGWGLGGTEIVTIAEGRLIPLAHFWSVPLDWFVATGALGLAAGIGMIACAWAKAGHEDRATIAAWMTAGLFLSASWPMWLVLFALLAEISRRVEIPGDKANPAPVVDDREPLADGGARALRAE